MMAKLSIWVYRWLICLYPANFRRDYGDLMLYVFEQACHDTQRQQGWYWLRLWYITTIDLAQSLYHEYRTNAMTQIINGYEVNEQLAEGAAATVYRAYDPDQSAQVALKLFKADMDAGLQPFIKSECAVHTALDHPNIPKCFRCDTADEGTYMVMEYISGSTLLDQLQNRNKPFTPRQVIEWAVTICDVLTYIHGTGYIYRDMKPSNIMLNHDGQLYLIDYGIIVADSGDGVAIGTEGYAPPEQYKGIVTVQSDIYALGATLHQLLTNRDPRYHEAHSFDDALPMQFNPDVSPKLQKVLMTALSHDPSERYQTATAFRDALLNA